MKIIFLSPNLHLILSETQKKLLEEITTVEYYTTPIRLSDIPTLSDSEEKIIALDPDFCNWKVTKGDIDTMKNVKAICLQTTGHNYIDKEYCKLLGVPVTNIGGYSTQSVAEYAIMLMFALARKLPLVIQNKWEINYEKYRGMDLIGKTVGVIGLGRIGTKIAELCDGLGMEVHYWSRSKRDERFAFDDMDSIFSKSRVIFIALPPGVESIIYKHLTLIDKESIVISISHPMNHEIFIDLVHRGKISGYGCDDDIGDISKLQGNIMSGATLGWYTNECFRRNGEQWIKTIELALQGKFPNQVN